MIKAITFCDTSPPSELVVLTSFCTFKSEEDDHDDPGYHFLRHLPLKVLPCDLG
jgi:hypothetical protein